MSDESDPKLIERQAASKAAYDAAIARGARADTARVEAAKAHACASRLQGGLSSGDEEDAEYERLQAERKARAKLRTPREALRIGVNVVRRPEDL